MSVLPPPARGLLQRLPVAALPVVLATGLLAPAPAAHAARTQPAAAQRATSGLDDEAVAARAAQRVLARAQRVFLPTPGRSGPAATAAGIATDGTAPTRQHRPRPVDPTLVLVALRRALPSLSRPDRQRARAILARPTDGKGQLGGWTGPEIRHSTQLCQDHVCLHWTWVGRDAPPHALPSRTPHQVRATLQELATVWDTEVGTLGYRTPKRDDRPASLPAAQRHLFDVYLSDVGSRGLYGFCSPEQRSTRSTSYCVLDDDFAGGQFGRAHTPLQNLQVTAAHEFFHAIQFAYDSGEDAWFMEASAAWMEDVVHPSVDDNLQYLANAPISRPWQPADIGGRSIAVYGSWIWLRYLTDRFGDDLVHRAWQHAAGPRYSLPALARSLPRGAGSFDRLFGDFAAANVAPSAFYDEGGRYQRYTARAAMRLRLGPSHPGTRWLHLPRLRHLSAAAVRLAPARGARRLAVEVRTPAAPTAPQVRLVLDRPSGRTVMRPLPVHQRVARAVVGFSPQTVRSVHVVVVNASRRMSACWSGTVWSCQGRPRDDDARFSLRASVVR